MFPTKESENARSFYDCVLREQGVHFESYGFFQQDDPGIRTAPKGDNAAWFKDPDGNMLSISKHKEWKKQLSS